MALKSTSNLAVANTVAQEKFQTLFNRPSDGVAAALVDTYSTGALTDENIMISFLNGVREWVGAKEYGNLEAFRQTVTLKTWEFTFSLPRKFVDYDGSGAVGRVISQALEQIRRNSDDKILFEALISNTGAGPTGVDGVSLLSTAHVLGSNTFSNKGSAALTFGAYDTAVQAMMGYGALNGEPLGIFPTHMIVGPKLRKTAMDITGANTRVVHVRNDGTFSEEGSVAGTAEVGATNRNNVFQGEVTLIIWDRLVGTYDDYWYLLDLSKGQFPLLMKNERDWQLIALTDIDDPPRFNRDEYVWSIEADKAAAAGAWPTIYASIL